MHHKDKHWEIQIDTGGTFTDCLGIDPDGRWHRTKVLSSSGLRGTIVEVLSDDKLLANQDWAAPNQFIKDFTFRLLTQKHDALKVAHFDADKSEITLNGPVAKPAWKGCSFEVISPDEAPVLATRLITRTPAPQKLPMLNLRLATTRGTNALLEGKGAKVALLITRGYGDFLKIGNQQRADLFALHIKKSPPLYKEVIEIDERIGSNGKILKPVSTETLKSYVNTLQEQGINSAAVVFLNSYINPVHEQRIKDKLEELGIAYISISSDLSPFVKLLTRAETTLVNAYLAPVMENYLNAVKDSMSGGHLAVMTSAGGLKNSAKFKPKDSLLSGPAAGVVGAAAVGKQAGCRKIISFDMGGTSTDVSRYGEDFEYIFEHNVGDAHLMAPAVAIETVAAGGGSICSFDGHTLQVGPESAGASPGPACYGAGGPLTLTDINVLAGRLDKDNFHIPIDKESAREKFQGLVERVRTKEEQLVAPNTILEGFLEIANQRMAGAIQKISLQKGYDPKDYALVSFGGAGGQHCCAIARRLQIKTIIIPKDAGLLSAYGLGHAVMEHFEEKQILELLDDISPQLSGMMHDFAQKGLQKLGEENPDQEIVVRRNILFMRLKGQESTLEIEYQKEIDFTRAFREAYIKRYGNWPESAVIEVESVRVIASTVPRIDDHEKDQKVQAQAGKAIRHKEIVFDGETIKTPVYRREEMAKGQKLAGPALILDPYSTLVLEPGWQGEVAASENLILRYKSEKAESRDRVQPEAIKLELFTHRFTSIAERMGEMLQRTAISVNIKERQDFSCALLSPDGELVVNAPHIPVHLGALGVCVRSVKKQLEMAPGDVIVTNHPAFGGSHLPDVTVITPVFNDEDLIGYMANRAHHAEIGGMRPGSMPPDAVNLAQEGVVIPPMYIMRKGEARFDQIEDQLSNAIWPTRNVNENMADLQAQVAANRQGAGALQNMAKTFGNDELRHYMKKIKDRAASLMRETIQRIPNGTYTSRELLDDGTPLCASWKVNDSTVALDFTGTGDVHPFNLNATPAIVNSVVMYVLRVLVDKPIPLNEGLLAPISISLPPCLLNPTFSDDPRNCPAVVGGNIEVSQRLTDTLLKPFQRIACGQGTMNNILFGNDTFGYYETVGGGSGAGPDFAGADAVHQHMTNTKGTDPEILEQRYPVRLDQYAIRKKSGGKGMHRGGDGIIREMTFLEPVKLSVLTQHRVQAPYGQQGGNPGKKGEQWVIRKADKKEILQSSDGCDLEAGDRFILHTPGGGGFGSKK